MAKLDVLHAAVIETADDVTLMRAMSYRLPGGLRFWKTTLFGMSVIEH